MTTITRGIIKAYDAANHRASVQVAGSLSVWLEGLPVSRDLSPGALVAGAECAVLLYTDDNPNDAVVLTVHGSTAGAAGPRRLADADGDTRVDVEASADEDKVRVTIAGVLTTLFQSASPHVDVTGDVRLSGGLGLRGSSPSPNSMIVGAHTQAGGGGLDGASLTTIADTGYTGTGMRGLVGEARDVAGVTAGFPYQYGLEFRVNHLGSGVITTMGGLNVYVQGGGPATSRYGASFEINPLNASTTTHVGYRANFVRTGAVTIPLVIGFRPEILLGSSCVVTTTSSARRTLSRPAAPVSPRTTVSAGAPHRAASPASRSWTKA